jgi:hypothetical protein
VGALDRQIGEVLTLARPGDLPRAVLHGQLLGRAGPAQNTPYGQHYLHEALGPAERRRRPLGRKAAPITRVGRRPELSRPPPRARRAAGGPIEDRLRSPAEGVVDLAAQLAAHPEVDRHRRGDHREGDGHARRARDAGPQGHSSLRST